MINEESKVVRGVYLRESTFRILSIIIALSALSLAWFFWFIFEMGFVIGDWATLNYPLNVVFMLLIDLSLASIVIWAFVSYFWIPRTIGKMDLIHCKKGDKLSKLVQECAAVAKVERVPEVYMQYNSRDMVFTIGKSSKDSKIVVNHDLLASLDDKELSALLFHELGHVANGDVGLMTWASVFQKSLKYWILFYTSVLIADVLIFYPSIANVEDWIRVIFFGSAVSYSILLPIFIYIFVTLGVRSASRIREFNADAFATRHVEPSLLLSSIRNSILNFASTNVTTSSVSKRKRLNNLSLLRWVVVRLKVEWLFSDHPSLKDRINNLVNKQQDKTHIRLPTIESSVYAGIVAAIFAIGWEEFLSRSDPFFGIITETNWIILWGGISLPSVTVCIILNVLPLWCDKEILRNVRGVRLSNALSKGFLVNSLVSGLCYFSFLTLMFHPFNLIDLYIGFDNIGFLLKILFNVLGWNSINTAFVIAASLVVFLRLSVKS